MKKIGILISMVIVVMLVIASTATYAFFNAPKASLVISQQANSNATVILELQNSSSNNLVAQTSKANNASSSGSTNDYLYFELTYASKAVVSGSRIMTTNLNITKDGLAVSNSIFDYLSSNIEYSFLVSKNNTISNPVPTAAFINHDVEFNLPDFVTDETGYVYLFVRFKSGINNELLTSDMLGAQIALTVSVITDDDI